jgi:hypothetical protein
MYKPPRSSVSADISKHTIWINCTDLKSAILAVKIHELLQTEFGYDDGAFLEYVHRSFGFSITVCGFSTVAELRADYAQAKQQARALATTPAHIATAKSLLDEVWPMYADLFCLERGAYCSIAIE